MSHVNPVTGEQQEIRDEAAVVAIPDDEELDRETCAGVVLTMAGPRHVAQSRVAWIDTTPGAGRVTALRRGALEVGWQAHP